MIRMNNQQAQNLIGLAADLKAIYEQKRETGEVQGDMPPSIAGMIEVAGLLQEQLEAPGHDGNLVDTVAEILNELPHGASLGGIRLLRLKQAILSPIELAKVKTDKQTVSCHSCGVEVFDGALLTAYRGQVRCPSCATADSIQVACSSGKGHVKKIELPDVVKKRIRITLRKADCPACTTGEVPLTIKDLEEVAQERDRVVPPPQVRNPIFGAGAGAVPTAAPPRTRPPQALFTARRQDGRVRVERQAPQVQNVRAGAPIYGWQPPPEHLRGLVNEGNPFLRMPDPAQPQPIAIDIETPAFGEWAAQDPTGDGE